MRRYLIAFGCAVLLFLTAACQDKNSVKYLSRDVVYFFYQTTCPHCHDAAKYIHEKYPHLAVKSLDIKMPGNQKLFMSAAKDYEVGQMAGTPLICFGDKYIMGWGEKDAALFDEYVKG